MTEIGLCTHPKNTLRGRKYRVQRRLELTRSILDLEVVFRWGQTMILVLSFVSILLVHAICR